MFVDMAGFLLPWLGVRGSVFGRQKRRLKRLRKGFVAADGEAQLHGVAVGGVGGGELGLCSIPADGEGVACVALQLQIQIPGVAFF